MMNYDNMTMRRWHDGWNIRRMTTRDELSSLNVTILHKIFRPLETFVDLSHPNTAP
jgi:hypothetical protein